VSGVSGLKSERSRDKDHEVGGERSRETKLAQRPDRCEAVLVVVLSQKARLEGTDYIRLAGPKNFGQNMGIELTRGREGTSYSFISLQIEGFKG
jgi:hypothetical protein